MDPVELKLWLWQQHSGIQLEVISPPDSKPSPQKANMGITALLPWNQDCNADTPFRSGSSLAGFISFRHAAWKLAVLSLSLCATFLHLFRLCGPSRADAQNQEEPTCCCTQLHKPTSPSALVAKSQGSILTRLLSKTCYRARTLPSGYLILLMQPMFFHFRLP